MNEKKKQQLIQVLYNASEPMTSASLASAIQVSKRSIISYIQAINHDFHNCIHSSHNGYMLDRSNASKVMNSASSTIPQSNEERVVFILHQLLTKDNIDVFDLCDCMFISFATLQTVLKKVKRKIAVFDLQLVTSDNKVMIQGSEKNKRKLLSATLYNESNVNFLNLDTIQHTFSNIDIEFIRQTICDTLNQFHYFINDYSLINLVLHVTITIERIRHHSAIADQIPTEEIPLKDSQIALQIARKLEDAYQIRFSSLDIDELTILLEARTTSFDYANFTINDINKFIGEDCMKLVQALIHHMEVYYSIDLSEQEFFIRFALHIKNLLIRTQHNYPSKNPLAEEIRMNCPLIYDAAVAQASIIKEFTGLTISEDEIAYIAFHLGSTIETQKRFHDQVKIILYCPSYYNMDTQLVKQLTTAFSDSILITDILTEERKLEQAQHKADFLLTMVPVNMYLSIPVYRINFFLTEKNMKDIQQLIYKINNQKRSKIFKQHLAELIRPELFIKLKQASTKEEIIHQMVENLIRHGYANEDLEEEILARESLSSTSFHNIAIPHSMKQNAKKTGICVLICDEAIPWSNTKVHLVLMLCFNRNERLIFNEIFEPLTEILNHPQFLKQVFQVHDAQSFIELLGKLLDS